MSERISHLRELATIAAVSSAAIFFAASASGEAGAAQQHEGATTTTLPERAVPTVDPADTLPHCFDKPLPLQEEKTFPTLPELSKDGSYKKYLAAMKIYNKTMNRWSEAMAPHKLSLPIINNEPEGLPPLSPEPNVDDAIVRINMGNGYYGSGFLVDDSEGREVVVTAAHVGAVAPLGGYTITDMAGAVTRPVGGCYVYENIDFSKTGNSKDVFTPFKQAGQEGSVFEDVAVLTLPQQFGNTVLNFAAQPVKRGDWVRFTNYQANVSINSPADYYGLVASTPPYSTFETYTGLVNYTTPSEAVTDPYANRAVGGCSGGVVTENGKVVGMSYASDAYPDFYDNAQSLQEANNIYFPNAVYGNQTGFTPTSTSLISASTIETVLQSPLA
jgi:hypothetical protein